MRVLFPIARLFETYESRAHECNQWAHPLGGGFGGWILTVEDRCGQAMHGHDPPAVIARIPGVTDAPVPIDEVVRNIRHVLRFPWAPAVRVGDIRMGRTGSQSHGAAHQGGGRERGDECSLHGVY